MIHSEITEIVRLGLEASLYESSEGEGLTHLEIVELCQRFHFKEGEIGDALQQLRQAEEVISYFGSEIITLNSNYVYFVAGHLGFEQEDPRILTLMSEILLRVDNDSKTRGRANVSLSVAVLSRRLADDLRITEHQVNVHIRLLEKYKCYSIVDGYIEKIHPHLCTPKFVESIASQRGGRKNGRRFAEIRGAVQEIISRRVTGKTVSTDPIRAFEERFEILDAIPFHSWWRGIVAEWQDLDDRRNSASVLVLSASLCEGALSFFAASKIHAGLTMTQRLPSEPRQWKLEVLISAASTGQKPLLIDPLRQRLIELNERRKIIHPGSFIELGAQVSKVPEIRPEQASEARGAVSLLLRAIVDWITLNVR